jgi:hypothetical protein
MLQHRTFVDSVQQLRGVLVERTDMDDTQIDAILVSLRASLSQLETILARCLDQQIEFIYKRVLTRRAHLAELRAADTRLDVIANKFYSDVDNVLATELPDASQRKKVIDNIRKSVSSAIDVHRKGAR